LNRRMLFISGTRDTFARQDLLQGVVDRIGDLATILWIQGGDHSLKVGRGKESSLNHAADQMESWIRDLR
jgi:predicted alpha/beta-hydrolase family hydrolase